MKYDLSVIFKKNVDYYVEEGVKPPLIRIVLKPLPPLPPAPPRD